MYCKIIKTRTEEFFGTEYWILTHKCGKTEKRLKRRRNSQNIKKAPIRVKCEGMIVVVPDISTRETK